MKWEQIKCKVENIVMKLLNLVADFQLMFEELIVVSISDLETDWSFLIISVTIMNCFMLGWCRESN